MNNILMKPADLDQNCFQNRYVRPNKVLSVFQVMGLKTLGRVGTHIFLIICLSETKCKFMH